MTKDTSNVFEFPSTDEGQTPLQVARALVDYVKARPGSHVLAIVSDPDEGSITMGWSKMDAAHMCMMLAFGRLKWEKSTFEEPNS